LPSDNVVIDVIECKAFGTLAGRLPMPLVDVDNMTASPHLPMVLRNVDTFRPLSQIVRGRHQVEFKRRFGLSGDKTGMDVDDNWRPTMTPAFGLPIMLDPRLNNIPQKMGLDEATAVEYEDLLHALHFEWYLKARSVEEKVAHMMHQEKLDLLNAIGKDDKELPDKPVSPTSDEDMGWDNPQILPEEVPAESIPEPPVIPLISESAFKILSAQNYKMYVKACRVDIKWKSLYPDEEYSVGKRGEFWQEKLHKVNLAPVWTALHDLNKQSQFGFFVHLAKHSRANIYKLQASSFVERVNSAGKIVFNETNLKLNPDKVEKRVMLRMNRKWVAHMKSTYPEVTPEMLNLLRASHDAMSQPPLAELEEVIAEIL
jgi:hypothetical protein